MGKLNVVFVEGKGPRLVLDSSVCNFKTGAHEKVVKSDNMTT